MTTGTRAPSKALSVGVDDHSRFRCLRHEWRALYRECPDATPFNSWEWLFSWWQAYGAGRELRLVSFRRDRQLLAIAPLYASIENTQLGTRCRVLRFVGDGSFDSDYLGLLVRADERADVARQLGEWLSSRDDWDALVLREISGRSPLPQELRDIAARHDLLCRIEYGQSGLLDLPGSFDEFLSGRQSRFRTRLRALLRALDDGDLTFESACEPRELRRRLRSLFALHEMRWHATGASGVFAQRTKRLFYAHFVPRFSRNGWLRLYSLRNGASYVAHQLCFADRGTTYLLQEGFDISNPSSSYGQMLRAAVIRHLISSAEPRYDFLGGYTKHKQDWGAREEKTVHAVLARKHWRGRLYFDLPRWHDRLATEAKRILPGPVLEWIRRSRQ